MIAICPLCNQSAAFEIVHDPYGKRFTCSTCTEFYVDEQAEYHLKDVPLQFRLNLCAEAKAAGPDHLLVMRQPNAAELKAQPRPKQLMISETISRTR